MGLFSRKEAGSQHRHASRPRPSVSSEAQAATLRVKARRRLTGAVALVLAVVVILPMLLDGEPKPVPSGIDISIPSKNSPYEAVTASQPQIAPENASKLYSVNPANPAVTASDGQTPPVTTSPSDSATDSTTAQSQTEGTAKPAAEDKPVQKPTPSTEPQRTDDGSRALALLEGKTTAASPTQPTSSQFIVQIASYSTEPDAKTRQDKLKGEGVSNAFVESSVVDGKAVYRLRVGPFVSREAAQAAQTRLRTLGYSNGFIATQ